MRVDSGVNEAPVGPLSLSIKGQTVCGGNFDKNTLLMKRRKNAFSLHYTRRLWDEVCPTIHTRNDLMASQNTIHPSEHRVYSIRELMRLMSIPEDFRWIDMDLVQLNALSDDEKRRTLKREEPNIRQSIGEAVPTQVFRDIAYNIKTELGKKCLKNAEIQKTIKEYDLTAEKIPAFITEHSDYSVSTLTRIAELVNAQRTKDEAYFTDNCLLNWVFMHLPEINKEEIHILEPAVGAGSFLRYIARKYENKKAVYIDVCDINPYMISSLKALVGKYNFGDNIHISYHVEDTLLVTCPVKYDLCIGNPPFGNANTKDGACYEDYLLIDNHGVKSGNTSFKGTAIRMRVPSKRIANAQSIISKIASQGETEAKTIRNAFKSASIPSKGLMKDLNIQ